jgi:Glycoside-hydrolase family GH114
VYGRLSRWGGVAVITACSLVLACSLSTAGRAVAGSGSAAAGPARVGWWRPPTGPIAWQWELDHPLSLHSPADLGTGDKTYRGHPAARPAVYDIDGFDNPAATVRALHRRHARVICYIEVGAAESYRPDYQRFPKSALGGPVPGYPDDRYLNISNPAVAAVIRARIAMCARKGFDAIEPDIDDSYTDRTGFRITEADNIAYDAGLAGYAHALGLAWGLKNGDGPGFAAAMLPHVDFALDEQCFQYRTCGAFYPAFAAVHKAVLEVEYQDQGGPAPREYCPQAIRDGFDSVEFDSALDGKVRVPCS